MYVDLLYIDVSVYIQMCLDEKKKKLQSNFCTMIRTMGKANLFCIFFTMKNDIIFLTD